LPRRRFCGRDGVVRAATCAKAGGLVGAEQFGVVVEVKRDVVLKQDCANYEFPGRQIHDAAAGSVGLINGFLNGDGVERLAVTHRAVLLDVDVFGGARKGAGEKQGAQRECEISEWHVNPPPNRSVSDFNTGRACLR